MKKILRTLSILGLVLLGSWGTAYAAAFLTGVGGTGTTTPSGILYGDNGTTNHLNTVMVGSNCTFVAGVFNCVGGGSGISTSSPLTSGQPLYATGWNTLASVASSTFLTSIGGQPAGNYATFAYPFPLNATSTLIEFSGGIKIGTFSGLLAGNSGSTYAVSTTSMNASITGNAGTVTNGVYTTGAGTVYENPLTFTWPLIRATNALSFDGLSTSSPISAASGLLYATGVNKMASIATSSAIQLSITGNAETVTTNANLSGVITSVGNTTSFGSQTAGVLGNVITGNTGVLATSTLYGVGTYGSVLSYQTNPKWVATSTLNLGVSSFFSSNISQWTNDSGYQTFAYPFPSNATTTALSMGNIGIGGTPSNALDIFTTTSATAQLKSSGFGSLAITFDRKSAANGSSLINFTTNGNSTLDWRFGESSIFTGTSDFVVQKGLAGSALVIKSANQYVGIGTTTPTSALGVQGGGYFSGTGFFGGALTATSTLNVTGLTSLINASSTQLTSGTNTFYVNSAGRISAKDTTVNVTGVISPMRYLSMGIATTTAWTATSSTNLIQVVAPFAGTIQNAKCHTDAGTLWADIYHTTTHLSLINASTTAGTISFSANNTVTSGEVIYMTAGTPASSPTTVSCTLGVTETL